MPISDYRTGYFDKLAAFVTQHSDNPRMLKVAQDAVEQITYPGQTAYGVSKAMNVGSDVAGLGALGHAAAQGAGRTATKYAPAIARASGRLMGGLKRVAGVVPGVAKVAPYANRLAPFANRVMAPLATAGAAAATVGDVQQWREAPPEERSFRDQVGNRLASRTGDVASYFPGNPVALGVQGAAFAADPKGQSQAAYGAAQQQGFLDRFLSGSLNPFRAAGATNAAAGESGNAAIDEMNSQFAADHQFSPAQRAAQQQAKAQRTQRMAAGTPYAGG